MDQHVAKIRLIDLDDFEAAGFVIAYESEAAAVAEADRFAVLESDDRLVAGVDIFDRIEGAVVEDGAVLVDFHEGCAAVTDRFRQDHGEVLSVRVDRSGDEGALSAEGQGYRVEGLIDRAEWRRLGDLM